MYGHIATLAKQEQKGIEAAGGKADIYQYVDHHHRHHQHHHSHSPSIPTN